MAMLRSAIGLALRQSAPASRLISNAARRSNPASNVTTTRTFFTDRVHGLKYEKFTWDSMQALFASIAFVGGMMFYHTSHKANNSSGAGEQPCLRKKLV
ncbi:hypothetical protein BRADI_5g03240v3 [Brachypodium distachyon]|uniref:Uncharacterized protein n=1 Tax=Brachypodium distachyon TaxID=15368 RepID=I1IW71_BRADI|nr:hypothetical protein BRADI_5g03240v3 [Brachypodium distachyon]